MLAVDSDHKLEEIEKMWHGIWAHSATPENKVMQIYETISYPDFRVLRLPTKSKFGNSRLT